MPDTNISLPTVTGHAAKPHGDNTVFQANPANYIATHACQLHAELEDTVAGGSGSATEAAFNRSGCGKQGKAFIPVAGQRITAKLVEASGPFNGMPLIKCFLGSGGKEVAFLPWQEDTCTVTTLSRSAELFLTGPLSGCNVYLATKNNLPPLVFHANANANSADVGLNNAAKDAEADRIAAESGHTITHRLARGEYELPAFVWGYRDGPTWSMFVHEFDIVTRKPKNTPLGAR